LSEPLECDVLIVGGGPAGLSVASHLAPGISSIVVHQDAEIGRPVRTSGGSFLRDMQALDIPPHLYQVIDRLDFYSDHEQASFRIQNDRMVVLEITGLYRYLAGLSDALDRKLLLGCKFITTGEQENGLYLSKVRSRAVGAQTIRSKYIIDASGWHSAVLESLNLGAKPDRTGVGIEYEFPRGNFAKNRAVLFVGATALTGYGWIFPTANNRLRLGVGVINPDTDLTPRQVMNSFVEGGHAARYGIEIPKEYDVNAGIIPSVPYDPKLVYGKVIRTGDAANFASPTVGEGIRMAIEQGRHLGQDLSACLAGDKTALQRYETRAAKAYARDYKYGYMMNRRIADYTPQRWDQAVRRLARLSEHEVTQMLRSNFSARLILRTVYLSLRAKFFG
jgi:digeranylgeranylglycerophospholipid reductase